MARPKKQKQLKSRVLDENAIFIYPEDIDPNDCHNNPKTCMDTPRFVDERMCNGCDYEFKCIYERKYKYYKPS